MKCSHVMQTELPLDFISSRSVKYSHSSGFSNASTGEINLVFFDHAIVPPDEEDKRRTLLTWIFFCLFSDGDYDRTNVLSLASRPSGLFSWGTFYSSWGNFCWKFGIFVGNFKGTLIFNFLGMLTVPDGSFAELSFNSNRSCIKKETSWGLLNAVESL